MNGFSGPKSFWDFRETGPTAGHELGSRPRCELLLYEAFNLVHNSINISFTLAFVYLRTTDNRF